MEPARLAASKQAATKGPGRPAEQQGSQNGKKKFFELSGMVSRSFVAFYVLADRTPTGRKSQNIEFSGQFGLGRPLAFGEIPGQKQGETQFPAATGASGESSWPPQVFLPESAQPFYLFRFGRPDPHGREITKYGFLEPLWRRTALGTCRNTGRKTEKHNFPELRALLGGKSVRPKVSP